MIGTKKYATLEFNGTALYPTFSIYLFEIIKEGAGTYFYVGMTGDNYYPSARSIMHRLGGHIDLSSRSTQSQFITALKKLYHKESEHLTLEDLQKLKIKLHHWPIEGFTRWQGDLKDFDKTDPRYVAYSAARRKVATLENKIISDFSGDILLNRTKGKDCPKLENHLQEIYEEIKKIITKVKKQKFNEHCSTQ